MLDEIFKIDSFDILNSGFSGILLILLTVIFRILFLRPRLHVTFDENSTDLARFVESRNPEDPKEILGLDSWVRLRIKNRGLLKLTNPKISCVEVIAKPNPGSSFSKEITPFELPWAEAFDGGNLGVLFPGNFQYRFDLAWLRWGVPGKDNAVPEIFDVTEFQIARKDRSGFPLILGINYEILLLIANDNFLIPSHYVKLALTIEVLEKTKIPTQDGIRFKVNILKQGDWWIPKSPCGDEPCCATS